MVRTLPYYVNRRLTVDFPFLYFFFCYLIHAFTESIDYPLHPTRRYRYTFTMYNKRKTQERQSHLLARNLNRNRIKTNLTKQNAHQCGRHCSLLRFLLQFNKWCLFVCVCVRVTHSKCYYTMDLRHSTVDATHSHPCNDTMLGQAHTAQHSIQTDKYMRDVFKLGCSRKMWKMTCTRRLFLCASIDQISYNHSMNICM